MTKLTKISFEEKVEELVKELKGSEHGSLEWQDAYAELYKFISPRVIAFCNKEVTRLKCREEIRASEHDYQSIALSEVMVKLVNDFDPNTQQGFMKLLYYRTRRAFTNQFNASVNGKQKALVTGIELKEEYFGEEEMTCPSLRNKNIYEVLREYCEINPQAKILWCYQLDGQKATERIKQELGIENYGSTERWRIHNIKQKFKKYIIEKGYTYLLVDYRG